MTFERDRAREALERAAGGETPDVSHLVDAVPALMAEARRRASSPADDLTSVLAARSWWAVPRLAVATAVAVLLASIALFVDPGTTKTSTTFESVVLDDAAGSSGGTGDLLLDAVLDAGRSDG